MTVDAAAAPLGATMIERVARAICPESPDGIDSRTGDDGRSYPDGIPHWRAWVGEARAAIEAMREPTRKMLVEGARESPLWKTGAAADHVWRAMIDAALGDASSAR